jgi:hypothetical protein
MLAHAGNAGSAGSAGSVFERAWRRVSCHPAFFVLRRHGNQHQSPSRRLHNGTYPQASFLDYINDFLKFLDRHQFTRRAKVRPVCTLVAYMNLGLPAARLSDGLSTTFLRATNDPWHLSLRVSLCAPRIPVWRRRTHRSILRAPTVMAGRAHPRTRARVCRGRSRLRGDEQSLSPRR